MYSQHESLIQRCWDKKLRQKGMDQARKGGKDQKGHRATQLGKEIKFTSKISLKSRKSRKLVNEFLLNQANGKGIERMRQKERKDKKLDAQKRWEENPGAF